MDKMKMDKMKMDKMKMDKMGDMDHMHGMKKDMYSDSNMKPDKTCHYKKEDMGTMAKDAKLPGQMYVPKKYHNENDWAGEMR